jgi:hypothetical protein
VPPTNTMTLITSKMHVLVAPWCVYTFPSKVVQKGVWAPPGEVGKMEFVGVSTDPLDKAASFGQCESTRSIHWSMIVYSRSDNQTAYWTEITS